MCTRIVMKILLDLLVLTCLGLSCLFLVLWGQPYKKGYFENDMSIRLPYRPETVSVPLIGAGGFLFCVFTIVIIEFARGRQGRNVGEKFLGNFLIPGWVWESYVGIGCYGFGAGCQQITSDLTKYITGRLRPHFYDVCRPVPNASSPLNALGYIQDYTCSSTSDAARLKDMRLSFPSAHASFAMYSAVFFICYVQVKGKWRGSKLLRHGVQLVVFLFAWFTGLSRVMDNFHHWEDVGFGFLIGAMYGFLVFNYILKPKKYATPSTWEVPAPQNMLPRPVLAR